MSKHTPGPWKVASGFIQAPRRDTSKQHDIDVARVQLDSGLYAGEFDANARLIAAAPDLLEALRNAVNAHMADRDDGAIPEWVHEARAAIAKAAQS
jgi:hypothetical protein